MLLKLVAGQGTPPVHALRDGADVVGWIRAGGVGFDGFAGLERARAAALRAAGVLTVWYEKRGQPIGHHAPDAWASEAGDNDLVRVKDVVVGRLLMPDAGDSVARGHAFELVMPPATWLAVMLQVAQQVHIELTAIRAAEEHGDAARGAQHRTVIVSGAA